MTIMSRAWTVQNKKEPSIFLKIQSKHRQVILSKFSKSLRVSHTISEFLVSNALTVASSKPESLDRAKQKGTFDFSQNLIKTRSSDFKQDSEEF